MEFALKLNDFIEIPHNEFQIQPAPLFKSYTIRQPLVHRRFYFRGSRNDDPPAHFLIDTFKEQE